MKSTSPLGTSIAYQSVMPKDPERNKWWREQNKEFIAQWRKKMDELRAWGYSENWHEERMEMEIAQLLDKELRNIWDFGLLYIYRTKSGSLREAFVDAIREIREYGTIEPYWKNHLLKSIETTRRKMKR